MIVPEVTIGNTICLRATFTDWDGQLPSNDPTDIVLRLYDHNGNKYGEDIIIDSTHKKSMGVYQYFLTVPDDKAKLGKESIMSYMFVGILDGTQIIDGGKFKRVFLKNR